MKKFYLLQWSMLLVLTFFYCFSYGQIPTGYYDPANGLTGDQLKAALHNIIDGHTTYPYSSSSGTDTWDILKVADRDPNNPNNVIGIYSGFSMDAAKEYDNGNGWTREHVWAKSRGDFGTAEGPGTDLHHLRAEDASTNSARSNRNFDNADYYYVDNGGNYNGATLSKTSDSEFIWEPRDEVKGDVARMLFYMVVRYEGTNGEPDLELTDVYQSSTSKEPLHATLSTLVQWSLNDPVSDAERARNEVVYSYQHNRNPFIDHPEYVCELYPGYCTSSGNTAPTFSSMPITTGNEGQLYTYNILTNDADGDLITLTASTKPTWLSFIDNGDGTGILTGTPGASDTGINSVVLNASDGTASTGQVFDINVNPTSGGGGGGTASELFISEYIEGSSYNKGLEIANFTGSTVDLSQYSLFKQTNGSGAWGSELALSGTLADGDVYVIVHSSASATMQAVADISTGSGPMSFNGNDPIALFKNGSLIDLLGTFNDASNFAQDVTLVRKSSVASPNMTYTVGEWDQYGMNTFDYLGSHTFDGGSSTPTCDVPSNLSASSVTTTSADLSWTGSAASYIVDHRIAGTTNWTSSVTSVTSMSLSGLTDGSNYEFRVTADCGSLTSTPSAIANFTTLAAEVTYCSSSAQYANEEWIERFEFNSIDNTSGSNNGYADYTALSTNVSAGSSYAYGITPQWSGRNYNEGYDIWIDFNHNGDFNDSGEHVVSVGKTRSSYISGTFAIPSSSTNGATRLRVTLKYNGNANSCEYFTYGEVEDYTINISGGSASARIAAALPLSDEHQFDNTLIYPNPVKGRLLVNMSVRNKAEVSIRTTTGQVIVTKTFAKDEEMIMNVSQLKKGLYIVTIKEEGNTHNARLLVE